MLWTLTGVLALFSVGLTMCLVVRDVSRWLRSRRKRQLDERLRDIANRNAISIVGHLNNEARIDLASQGTSLHAEAVRALHDSVKRLRAKVAELGKDLPGVDWAEEVERELGALESVEKRVTSLEKTHWSLLQQINSLAKLENKLAERLAAVERWPVPISWNHQVEPAPVVDVEIRHDGNTSASNGFTTGWTN